MKFVNAIFDLISKQKKQYKVVHKISNPSRKKQSVYVEECKTKSSAIALFNKISSAYSRKWNCEEMEKDKAKFSNGNIKSEIRIE